MIGRTWQLFKHRFVQNERTMFLLATLALILAITFSEYMTDYLRIEARPLPTTKIMTKHPQVYPLPQGVKPFALADASPYTNVAVLTYAAADQPGNHMLSQEALQSKRSSNDYRNVDFHNMSDTERQMRIIEHPIATVLLPSLLMTAEKTYKYTVYIGFDNDDPLFDNESARRALDTALVRQLTASMPATVTSTPPKDLDITLKFTPIYTTEASHTMKMNYLARIAYADDVSLNAPKSVLTSSKLVSPFAFTPSSTLLTTAMQASTANAASLPAGNNANQIFLISRPNTQILTKQWTTTASDLFVKNTVFPGFGVLGWVDRAFPNFPTVMALTRVHLDLFDGDLFQTNMHKFTGLADGWLFSVYKAWASALEAPLTCQTLYLDAYKPKSSKSINVNVDDGHNVFDRDIYMSLSLPKTQRPSGLSVASNIEDVQHLLWRQVIKGRKRLNMALTGVHYDAEFNGRTDERNLNAMTHAKMFRKVENVPLALGKVVPAPNYRLVNVFDNCVLFESVCKLYAEKELQRKMKQ